LTNFPRISKGELKPFDDSVVVPIINKLKEQLRSHNEKAAEEKKLIRRDTIQKRTS
jgi:hypothetical protein